MSDSKGFQLVYHNGEYQTANFNSWDEARYAYGNVPSDNTRAVVHNGRVIFSFFWNNDWRSNVLGQFPNGVENGKESVPSTRHYLLIHHWDGKFNSEKYTTWEDARDAFTKLGSEATRVLLFNGEIHGCWFYNDEWRNRILTYCYMDKFMLLHHNDGKYNSSFYDTLSAARVAHSQVPQGASRVVVNKNRVWYSWHYNDEWYKNISSRAGHIEKEEVHHHYGNFAVVHFNNGSNKYVVEPFGEYQDARDAFAKIDSNASRAVFNNGFIVLSWFYNEEWRNNIINAAK